MPDDLTVHLNREALYAIEAPERFETDGSFRVVVENHGEPTHVHLRLDEALSAVAGVEASNHFVEDEQSAAVTVDGEALPASGTLAVVTGYGANEVSVEVTVAEPRGVVVDESLGTPATPDRPSSSFPVETAVVAALGVVAVAIAVGVALLLGDPVLVVVVLAVVFGLAAAAYALG